MSSDFISTLKNKLEDRAGTPQIYTTLNNDNKIKKIETKVNQGNSKTKQKNLTRVPVTQKVEIRRVKKIEVNLMLRVRNRRSREFQIGERKVMVLHRETINYNFLAKYFNMVIIAREGSHL